jgi:hypothetical protein
MFSFVLVMVEIFECFGRRNIMYLSVWPACLKRLTPLF